MCLDIESSVVWIVFLTLNDVSLAWDGLFLDIDYVFSAPIDDEIISYTIVSGENCNGRTITDREIETTLIKVSDSAVRLSLLLNPGKIYEYGAPYVSHYEKFSMVGMMHRLDIYP